MDDLMDNIIKIARLGGDIIKKDFGGVIHVKFKGRADLVTETDLKVEKIVTDEVKKLYPDHSIVCEEKTGEKQADSGYVWYIDPVDGTTNFAHSFPFVCISLGVELNGEMLAGVVFNPILDELFHACKGSGAFLNGSKIEVSNTDKLELSMLVTGFAYNFRKVGAKQSNFENFFNLSKEAQAIRRTGSAALDLCYVARGVFDGFWELYLNTWDISAGSIIITEAGGTVSDFNGGRLELSGDEILATNGHIHKDMISALV